ncbi:tRNA (N6-threonylcarbamoyladenosine(37)-N6)-methyltransferase TrmO [Thermodesulfobacteriota bacterium]
MSINKEEGVVSERLVFSPVGVIRSPFHDVKGMPIQPAAAHDVPGQVIVDHAYSEGLKDIEGFSHIIVIYCFHSSRGFALTVTPFLDAAPHGVFATRAPRRPNPIGISVLKLLRREPNTLHVTGVDVVDGTPLLDIKPYVPCFDAPQADAIGWLEGKAALLENTKSDSRFEQENGVPAHTENH